MAPNNETAVTPPVSRYDPDPYLDPAMPPVLPLVLTILSQFPDSGWRETIRPCIDTLLADVGSGDWVTGEFGDPAAIEECDPEEASLFTDDRARENPRRRESARLSFTVSRSPGDDARSTTRHSAARNGWDDRIELHDDAPGRWRLGYTGDGWRVVAGEMTDTALPAWPRGLPRRALPVGWRAAQGMEGTEENPRLLSAPVPQGIAAGALHTRWKAYALRAWNPVETGEEPPWNDAWNLRHTAMGFSASTGASVSLPWTASLHLADTRIARDGVDTLSERLYAAGLASPAQGKNGGVDLSAALSESDASRSAGWFIAVALRREFERGGKASLTLRQRSGAWTSAWDPAIAEDAAYGAIDPDEADDSEGAGAGEIRVSGRLPFHGESERRASRFESGFARGEAWSAWNPRAGGSGTSRRGTRVALGRRAGDARLELSGTHRVSRSASGSLSVYRLAQAEARVESFPGWRASAWRSWNGEGPLRTGLFVGLEPAWETLRLAPGFRLEETSEGFEGRAVLEARLRLGGWSLDASAALPCGPAPDAGAARWRLTASTGR
jgi:hypothetical protein